MTRSRSSAAVLALALLASTASAGAGDPFEPGLRWVRPAQLADAWIPTSVGFAGEDELCWSVSNGATPRVGLDASAARGLSIPLFEDQLTEPLAGTLRVTTSSARDGLFVLQQTYASDPTQRNTSITRYDPLAAALGAEFTPAWTLDLGLGTNGPARLLTDRIGDRGFAVLWQAETFELWVVRLDLRMGHVLDYVSYPADSLDSATISADGTRLAITSGTTLRVLDDNAALVQELDLFAATPTIALDADGSHLLIGRFGGIQLLVDGENGYEESLLIASDPLELAKVVDLSADGSVLAVGWWHYVNGHDARFEVLDGNTGVRLREIVQSGAPGGLQNSPSAIEVSADGQRIACGSWGDGDADPELVLLDLGQDEPVLEANLPGSILHLDLDESGTRILVAAKHLHANQMGVTGEVRLYDTGERDLQLLQAPRPGGALRLAARADGALAAWFLLGRELETPFGSGLALVRHGLRVIPAAVEGGVAELDLALPPGGRVLGLSLTIQAAFRVPGSLSFTESVVNPIFL